ncbi:MAG: DUF1559 domain-containing protein [Pirellulaceae bacterium]
MGALLLPQLEQSALHGQLRFNDACWSPANAAAVASKIPAFLCPSASGGAMASRCSRLSTIGMGHPFYETMVARFISRTATT